MTVAVGDLSVKPCQIYNCRFESAMAWIPVRHSYKHVISSPVDYRLTRIGGILITDENDLDIITVILQNYKSFFN